MDAWAMSVYWVCLIVGVGYSLVALIMGGSHGVAGTDAGGMGNGGDFNHNYGMGGTHGQGQGSANGYDSTSGTEMVFGPFSPLVIAFFLTCFGGVGVLVAPHFSPVVAMLMAFASGIVLAWLLIYGFNKLLGSLPSSSEIKLASLVGLEAEVTVALPPTGVGEIAYVAMGSRNVAPAHNETGTTIPRFSSVRISRIVGNMFYVVPIEGKDGN